MHLDYLPKYNQSLLISHSPRHPLPHSPRPLPHSPLHRHFDPPTLRSHRVCVLDDHRFHSSLHSPMCPWRRSPQ